MLKHSRLSPSKHLARHEGGFWSITPTWNPGEESVRGVFSAGVDVWSHKSPTSGSRREAPGFN